MRCDFLVGTDADADADAFAFPFPFSLGAGAGAGADDGPAADDAQGGGGADAVPTVGVGAPLLFSRVHNNFLAVRVEGEVKTLDVRHHRYHEGNTLTVCGTAPGADSKRARTWAPLGGKDFVFNKDGTVSPARAPKMVLGAKLLA